MKNFLIIACSILAFIACEPEVELTPTSSPQTESLVFIDDLPIGGGEEKCGSQSFGRECLVSSGVIATENRQVAAFTGIDVAACKARVFLSQGNQSVSISAPDNLLPVIDSDVENGNLVIRIAEDTCVQLNEDDEIIVTVSIPSFEALAAAASSGFEVEGAWTGIDDLEVNISSSAFVNIENAWSADNLTLNCTSSAEFKGFDLTVDECNATVSTGGRAEITVNDVLSGLVSTGGVLSYRGNPSISVTVLPFTGGQLIDAN